jgi:hypothetical protein
MFLTEKEDYLVLVGVGNVANLKRVMALNMQGSVLILFAIRILKRGLSIVRLRKSKNNA